MEEELTRCIHCGALILPSLGHRPPDGEDRAGTFDDPRAPGDYNNICDVCNYRGDLRGGPGL